MRPGPERHQIAYQRRGAADCGQYRQTAKAVDALTRIRGAAGSARRRKIGGNDKPGSSKVTSSGCNRCCNAVLALLSIAGCAQYVGKGKAPPPAAPVVTKG